MRNTAALQIMGREGVSGPVRQGSESGVVSLLSTSFGESLVLVLIHNLHAEAYVSSLLWRGNTLNFSNRDEVNLQRNEN